MRRRRTWHILGLLVLAVPLLRSDGVAQAPADDDLLERVQALDTSDRPCEAFHLLRQLGDRADLDALSNDLRHRCHPTERIEERVRVGGGTWTRQEDAGDRVIAVDDFYLDRTEVTVAAYRRCIRAGVCRIPRYLDYAADSRCNLGAPDREAHPMNCVDWFGASAYCGWRGGRLPSEAELEWAGSAGGTYVYPWGWMMPTCDRANFRDLGEAGCGLGSTWPVGSHPDGASPEGIQDLAGNVGEWALDGFETRLPLGHFVDPVFTGDARRHAARGGSWLDSMGLIGSRVRLAYWATSREPDVGFRCAADADLEPPTREEEPEVGPGLLRPEGDRMLVPGGTFQMGSERGLGDADESPMHEVHLDAFFIERNEVTVADYRHCVVEGGCRTLGFRTHAADHECNYGGVDRDQHPMNCVNWYSAQELCHWAGGRLPTEAEWERAARGVDHRLYPWGEDPPDCSLTNFNADRRRESSGCGAGATMAVGLFPGGAGPFGTLDLAGNVEEWVADWYDAGYYALSPAQDPPGPLSGSSRVLRGGSFDDPASDLRSAQRTFAEPTATPPTVGFRCAWPAPAEAPERQEN